MTAAGRLLAIAVALDFCAGLAAQTPQPVQNPQTAPVFRGGATLVPVDVRVLDRAGKPVTDLRQDEFAIFENGAPQQIRHFATQAFAPRAPDPADVLKSRTIQTQGLPAQDRRVFLLVLGRGRLQPPSKGVDGVLHLVRERLLPQDLVAVMAWNRATEFTTDHAQVAELLERFKRAHEGIEGRLKVAFSGLAAIYGSKEIPQGLQHDIDAVFDGPGLVVHSTQPSEGPNAVRLASDHRETLDQLMGGSRSPSNGAPVTAEAFDAANASLDEYAAVNSQSMQDLGKLYAGIEYLRHFDGEKHLIFLSETGLVLPRSGDDRDVAALASDARVVIDSVHTGGTSFDSPFSSEATYSAARRGLPPTRSRPILARPLPMGWQSVTARVMADLTGGRSYWNQFPNVAAGLDDLDAATRFDYILGYYPGNPAADDRFRHIRVVVTRPGVTVLYRHGYYASTTLRPLDRRQMLTFSRVSAAAVYPKDVDDLGIQATATTARPPGTADVHVDARIDPTHVAFTKANGRNVADLDLLVGCLDGRDRLLGQVWQTVKLSFTDERLAEVKRDGVPVSLSVAVSGSPEGAKRVKIVMYDYGADRVGSRVVAVKVQ